MIRDLHEQNAAFATWRSSLDKLFKKGLPKGLVDELSAMGPEQGQALVDNLLKGKPGQVKQLIAEWNRKNKQIKDATKMDFTSEILAFKKAGGDMGDAIINGFKSAQVGLWFDGWVKTTFPGVINSAVNQAIADWKKTNPPPEKAQVVIPPDPRNTPSLKTGITAKQRRIEQQSQIAIAKLTAKQTIEQIARTQRRIGATRAGGVSKAEQAILARQNRRLNRLRRHQDELRGPERKGHGRDLPRSAQPKRPLGNTNNTNNSKTINVKMETKSVTGDSAADKRRQAFILAGKLKSLLA
jgi:hypothetical protein